MAPTYPDPEIDQGRAWVVMAASFVGHLMTFGVSWTTAVYFEALTDQFGNSASAVSLTAALNTALVYGTGPLAGVLTNRFGHRRVALCGGLLAGSGLILSALASNIIHLYITYGVLAGCGMGIFYIPCISIVSFYFDQYRTVALGVAVSGIGLGTFIFPPLVQYLIDEFGWRGALLLNGGLMLHLVVCAGVFAEPQRYKKLKAQQAANGRPRQIWNFHIFRNPDYLMLCANNFLMIFGISIVYVHVASFARQRDFSRYEAALIISVIGIANLLGRVLFGVVGRARHIRPILLYACTMMAAGVVVLLTPLSTSLVGLGVSMAAFGLLTGSLGPLLPQVIAEILSVPLIASGYGNVLIFESLGNFTGPPLAGFIYDQTRRYAHALYLCGAALVACGVIMLPPGLRTCRLPTTTTATESAGNSCKDTHLPQFGDSDSDKCSLKS